MSTLRNILLTIACVAQLNAATNYVSTSGNDSTGDGTVGNPWLTIKKGVQGTTSGNTLLIRGGTYSEQPIVASDVNSGTSPSSRTVISSYPGEWAVFRSASSVAHAWTAQPDLQTGIVWSNLFFHSFAVDMGSRGTNKALNAFKLRWSQNIIWSNMWLQNNPHGNGIQYGDSVSNVISGCRFTNFAQYKYLDPPDDLADGKPIYNWRATNCVYEYNSFDDCLHGALQLGTTSDNSSKSSWEMYPVIRGNVFGENDTGLGATHGIYFQDAVGAQVYNNVIHGCRLSGINISGDNNVIANNTIYGTGGSGFYALTLWSQRNAWVETLGYKDYSSTNNTFVNNIVWGGPAASAVTLRNTGFVTQSYWTNNIFNSVSSDWTDNTDKVSVNTWIGTSYDPQFTAAPGDLTFTESSFARNHGYDMSGLLTDDIIGVSRPQEAIYDVGAYEWDAGGQLPTVHVTASGPAYELGLIPASFTFTRTESNSGNLTVYYTQSGTSVEGVNHIAFADQVTIADGQWTATATVTPIEIGGYVGNVTVTVTLDADAAYTISTPSSATITIVEGSVPPGAVTVRPDDPGKTSQTGRRR